MVEEEDGAVTGIDVFLFLDLASKYSKIISNFDVFIQVCLRGEGRVRKKAWSNGPSCWSV